MLFNFTTISATMPFFWRTHCLQHIRNRNMRLAHYNRSPLQIFLYSFSDDIFHIVNIPYVCTFHSRYGDNCGRINLSCFVEKCKPNFQKYFFEKYFSILILFEMTVNDTMLVCLLEIDLKTKLNYGI